MASDLGEDRSTPRITLPVVNEGAAGIEGQPWRPHSLVSPE